MKETVLNKNINASSFLGHIRPKSYNRERVSFSSSFFLEFLAIFFLVLEYITGAILMIYYIPSTEKAYTSIIRLQTEIPFGWLARDLHRLGGELILIVTLLHLLRVIYKGTYKKEYSVAWMSGIFLLFSLLILLFSGYLLPWDQLAYWAITISISMVENIPYFGEDISFLLRGGTQLGNDGLLRFYLVHIVFIPSLVLILLGIHYYRAIKGRKVSEKKSKQNIIPLYPDIVIREITISLFLLFFLFIAATFFYNAPLESFADPTHTPRQTHAPWYFLWLQGALQYGNTFTTGICLPLIFFILLLFLPFLDRTPIKTLKKRPIALNIVFICIVLFIYLSVKGKFYSHKDSVHLSPAVLLEEIIPEEHKSQLHHLPFSSLKPGVYEIKIKEKGDLKDQLFSLNKPHFATWIQEFYGKINLLKNNPEIFSPTAVILVEEYQYNLKKITIRIHWLNKEKKTFNQEKTAFIHKERIES